MAFEFNEGQGSLFKNTYKNPGDPNDRKPDFKGSGKIDGKLRIISAWRASTRTGEEYFQLRIEDPRPAAPAPEARPAATPAKAQTAPNPYPKPRPAAPAKADDPQDDLPF